MTPQKDIQKIKEITEEFFQKMTVSAEITVKAQKEQMFSIDAEIDAPQVLIGEGGKTLNEIQHILKIILKRNLQISAPFFIDLDIAGYKKKKRQYLKELARSLADEVSLARKEKTLSPMPASERRIIHLELAERKDVVTESIGEEPERRIVIRPCP